MVEQKEEGWEGEGKLQWGIVLEKKSLGREGEETEGREGSRERKGEGGERRQRGERVRGRAVWQGMEGLGRSGG